MKGKSRLEVLRAAGMMSGPSLDGVNLAVVETDGVTIRKFGETRYRAFSEAERGLLRRGLGLWPGEDGVTQVALCVEDAHIDVARGLSDVDLIGLHGQTLAHEPAGRGTHQAGDGARVAHALGITTVWTFRSGRLMQLACHRTIWKRKPLLIWRSVFCAACRFRDRARPAWQPRCPAGSSPASMGAKHKSNAAASCKDCHKV